MMMLTAAEILVQDARTNGMIVRTMIATMSSPDVDILMEWNLTKCESDFFPCPSCGCDPGEAREPGEAGQKA